MLDFHFFYFVQLNVSRCVDVDLCPWVLCVCGLWNLCGLLFILFKRHMGTYWFFFCISKETNRSPLYRAIETFVILNNIKFLHIRI